MFQRFFDEGLAQASFLAGCDRTKQAIVVDPRRDAAIYLEAARQAGMTIVAAIETHVHADFLSGAHELAAKGVDVLCGPGAGLAYPHREVRDRERLAVGDLSVEFLHTPGHTPEHICVRLTDGTGQRATLLTGDLLFVGGVGRPDLLGKDQTRALAGQLFDSLRRVLTLPGHTEVHPGHGAGSLCGAGIGKEPSSTIDRERVQNALLRFDDRGAFVDAVLGDLPETPAYFSRMKRINAEGPPLRGLADRRPTLPSIRPAAAAALAADGAIVIDLRPADAFARAHPYGAVNLGFGSKIGYWAGWVLPEDTPLLLLSDDPSQFGEAALQLLRVGLDRLEGVVSGGFSEWLGAALPVASIDQMPAASLRAGTPAGVHVIDVRSTREFAHGHVAGALHVPLGDIAARAADLPRDGQLATICEGGYRSSLAASLLAREGVQPLINITGGMAAYRQERP